MLVNRIPRGAAFTMPPFRALPDPLAGLICPPDTGPGGFAVKLSAAMTALVLLGAVAPWPALAQSPAPAQSPAQSIVMPRMPPGAIPAFNLVRTQCQELTATYKGGMLSGKISVGEEPVTEAMKAITAYPTDAEAVVLRGYLGAVKKCAELQMEFLKTYAPWDMPSANILNDGQQPVYFSLMSKQITYGMANRNLVKAAAEAKQWQDENWPKIAAAQGGGVNPLDEVKAAQKKVAAQCDALYAPLKAGPLNGKMAVTRADPTTPQMLMNHDKPNDAEMVAVKALQAAVEQCDAATLEVDKNYAPAEYLPEFKRQHERLQAVFADLIAKRLTFGEANQKFYDVNTDATARLKAIAARKIAERNAQKAAANPQQTAQAAAPQTAAQPAPQSASPNPAGPNAAIRPGIEAAFQDMNHRCAVLYAPFRSGVLAGKIAFDYHKTTPAMLADTSIPDDAQAAAVTSYMAAFQLCKAYESRYVHGYMPWLQDVTDHSVQLQIPVLTALGAKKISFGEAAGKIQEIETENDAEAKTILEARKAGGTSAVASQGHSMFESLQPGAVQKP
jgi:hypothetical protein